MNNLPEKRESVKTLVKGAGTEGVYGALMSDGNLTSSIPEKRGK